MPLGQTSLQGIRKVHVELGERALVLGLGLVGQLAAQLIKLDGAVPVIGVDRIQERLRIALECGIDEVIDARNENWIAKLEPKPQIVIESTGAPEAVSDALRAVSKYGRVSLVGCPRGVSEVDFYHDVHLTGVTIVGAHALKPVPEYESRPGFWTWRDDALCFMDLLRRGRIVLEPLITERVDCKDIEDAFRELLEWKLDKLGIIVNWK
jgi:threonine dehydrogenase-like Zn-dependent dehydrogenase